MRIEFHKLVASDVSHIMEYWKMSRVRSWPMIFTGNCARSFRKLPILPNHMRYASVIFAA